MIKPFWRRAFELEERLSNEPAVDPGDRTDLIAGLREDLPLQRFIFEYKQFADPEWLDDFRREGLFAHPPSVEHRPDGVRALGWPAMRYLVSVADRLPAKVEELLVGLDTDNWWVIADALEAANHLPIERSVRSLPYLFTLWEAAPVQWTRPEVLKTALLRLSARPRTLPSFTQAATR